MRYPLPMTTDNARLNHIDLLACCLIWTLRATEERRYAVADEYMAAARRSLGWLGLLSRLPRRPSSPGAV